MKRNPIVKFAALLVICCMFFGCKPEDEIEKFGIIYGTVTDFASGEPISNVNVRLNPRGETTLTGSDGTFQFNDLAAGSYSLSLSKNGYVDLDDDYVIKIENGNTVQRAIQMQKVSASLQIVDNDGNIITMLDFGSDEDVSQKTFNIFNNGNMTLDFTITKTSNWIEEVAPLNGIVNIGDTRPIYVIIDRNRLSYGENQTNLLITTLNSGGVELTIKATKGAGLPTVTTSSVTNITSNSASCGGDVTSDGGSGVTSRGICWSTAPNPTINDNTATSGGGTGAFSCNMSNLQSNTTYHIRAYAKNSAGVSYGADVPFKTDVPLPTFQYGGNTYYVAPDPELVLYWEEANDYCNSITLYGLSGWRLPTKNELLQMYVNRNSIGGFHDYYSSYCYECSFYWSSTPSSYYSYEYMMVDFDDGSLYDSGDGYWTAAVRPIRKKN